MRPDSSTTVSRPDLGALAYEHMRDQQQYIGLSCMPVFEVPEQSMEYPVIPLEAQLKARSNTRRASRSGYARADWEFKMGIFSCAEHGWEELVDDAEANLYSRFFDAESVSTEIATDVLLRGHESRVSGVLAGTGNSTAATAVWSSAATATPKQDIQNGINAMRAAYGIRPNRAVMSWNLFSEVLLTDELKNYLQYTSPHLVEGLEAQRQTLARYFGVDEVLVGDVQEDSGKRGKAASLVDLWANDEVYLIRASDGSPNLRDPSVGRTFLWTGDSPSVLTVETYREEATRSTVVRVRHNVDEAVQYAGAVHKVTGV